MTDNEPGAERDIEDAVARAVAAVASLPLDQRKVLTVAVSSDLSYAEIAEQGGFEQTAVLSWMRSGLHAIAQALDDQVPWDSTETDEGFIS